MLNQFNQRVAPVTGAHTNRVRTDHNLIVRRNIRRERRANRAI